MKKLAKRRLPGIVEAVYSSIPDYVKEEISKLKDGSFNRYKTHIRIQAYISKELYLCLAYLSALDAGEGSFFSELATDYITQHAFKIGMANIRRQQEYALSGGR